jgi:hypothetical protein
MRPSIFCGATFAALLRDGSRAVVDQAVESVKAGENAKVRLALQAPCAMTVGAKNRALTEAEKRHVEGLCGGSSGRLLTVDDL